MQWTVCNNSQRKCNCVLRTKSGSGLNYQNWVKKCNVGVLYWKLETQITDFSNSFNGLPVLTMQNWNKIRKKPHRRIGSCTMYTMCAHRGHFKILHTNVSPFISKLMWKTEFAQRHIAPQCARFWPVRIENVNEKRCKVWKMHSGPITTRAPSCSDWNSACLDTFITRTQWSTHTHIRS